MTLSVLFGAFENPVSLTQTLRIHAARDDTSKARKNKCFDFLIGHLWTFYVNNDCVGELLSVCVLY